MSGPGRRKYRKRLPKEGTIEAVAAVETAKRRKAAWVSIFPRKNPTPLQKSVLAVIQGERVRSSARQVAGRDSQ
jgi:hypothetical protein